MEFLRTVFLKHTLEVSDLHEEMAVIRMQNEE